MMQSLHAGGLGVIHVPAMEQANPFSDGYAPNPGGLYEVGLGAYMNSRVLRCIRDGNRGAIKILFDGLPNLAKGDYKIIFMERDVDEIDMSTKRVDKHILSQSGGQRRLASRADEITAILPFCVYRPYNQEDIDHVLGICEARKDMEVIKVNYADLIDNPISIFEYLVKCGIPVNPDDAAKVIDPQLYRVRL